MLSKTCQCFRKSRRVWITSWVGSIRCTLASDAHFPELGSGMGCAGNHSGCSGQPYSQLWLLQRTLRSVANRDWATKPGSHRFLTCQRRSAPGDGSGSGIHTTTWAEDVPQEWEPPLSCAGPTLRVHPSWTLTFCGDMAWILVPHLESSRFTCLLPWGLKAAQVILNQNKKARANSCLRSDKPVICLVPQLPYR